VFLAKREFQVAPSEIARHANHDLHVDHDLEQARFAVTLEDWIFALHLL
jgi:hypothetical protein